MASQFSSSINLRSMAKKSKISNPILDHLISHTFEASIDGSPLSFDNLDQHIDAVIKSKSVQDSVASTSSPTPGQKTTSFAPSFKQNVKTLFSDKKSKLTNQLSTEAATSGRVGLSDDVGLQKHSLDTIPGNNLAIIGNNNFQSVKVSHCVFKGKWMYEVLLGSSGLMQVGWCLSSCKFNREEGVGDTKDSYAFDGYREAKWNSRTSTKYGTTWQADDVVTCLLNLDDRNVSFMLNGKDLGIAFTNVSVGPGYAYFPGLSLAIKEIAYCNFGHRPFSYPVEGYQALQSLPTNLIEAKYLTECLTRFYRLPRDMPDLYNKVANSQRNIVLANIIQRLSLLMKTVYNIDAFLIPFLLDITPKNCPLNRHDSLPSDPTIFKDLHNVLTAFWEYTEVKEAKDMINCVFSSVLRNYRSSPATSSLETQKNLLIFVQGLFLHQQTKRHVAVACSFDRNSELPCLFHIKHISKHNESELNTILTDNLLSRDSNQLLSESQSQTDEEINQKSMKQISDEVLKLKERIIVLKCLQRGIMRLLMVENTNDGLLVSVTFVKYFRNYLKNICVTRTNDMTAVCSAFVLHSFMQRLLDVIRSLWDHFSSSNSSYIPSSEAYIPIELFYTDAIDYFELQRAGGLKSFLFNEHKDALAKEGVTVSRGRGRRPATEDGGTWSDSFNRFITDEGGPSAPSLISEEDSDYDAFTPVIRLARALLSTQSNKNENRNLMVTRQRLKQAKEEAMPTKASLLELSDGCLLLYCIVVHQQMDKLHTIRGKVSDYTSSLRNIERKNQLCSKSKERDDIRTSLHHSHQVLSQHLTDLKRSFVWLRASIYCVEAQHNLWWLFRLALRTIHLSASRGSFFKFMPEFYLTATTKLYKCLREYISPTIPLDNLPEFRSTLHSFINFLSKFHCDQRIVNNDVKTSLANTIATFVTYPEQLEVVESLEKSDMNVFVRNMMYAYDEDKPWTSVGHRILATLWRGSGFAMSYDHPPYVRKVRQLLIRDRDPFIPVLLLEQIKQTLLSETELSSKFIHSILEHLNWSFSEFIGQLQEVQQQNARTWDNQAGILASLDAQALRQLRIVDMLFELSVALIRVLELTVALAPHVYLDWENRDSSETLMYSLVQCINQILSRATTKENLFEKVVAERQPGLSTVQHYPLMTGSSGILFALLNQDREDWKERALKKITGDPSFSIKSINFLLNLADDDELDDSKYQRGDVVPYSTLRSKRFKSLSDYEEVSDREVSNLRQVVRMLRFADEKRINDENEQEPMDEDNLCSICYAHEVSVIFKPCGHSSCRTCINMHRMTSNECFYCKAIVQSICDITKGTQP